MHLSHYIVNQMSKALLGDRGGDRPTHRVLFGFRERLRALARAVFVERVRDNEARSRACTGKAVRKRFRVYLHRSSYLPGTWEGRNENRQLGETRVIATIRTDGQSRSDGVSTSRSKSRFNKAPLRALREELQVSALENVKRSGVFLPHRTAASS